MYGRAPARFVILVLDNDLLCITHSRIMTSHRVTQAMVLKPVPQYMVVIVTCTLILSIRKIHTTQRTQ